MIKLKEFSKKMLALDYAIMGVLLVLFVVMSIINGVYIENMTNQLLLQGIDISMVTLSPPFTLDTFGVIITGWAAQLGVSSATYYLMAKSDHKVQLPMAMINTMPEEIRESVDMTQVITTLLSTTDN